MSTLCPSVLSSNVNHKYVALNTLKCIISFAEKNNPLDENVLKIIYCYYTELKFKGNLGPNIKFLFLLS